MAVKIRLARGGAKKRPVYSIVAADVRAPRDGNFLEKLGIFTPQLSKDNKDRIVLKEDRIKDWLQKGAIPTDRVARFLDAAGLMQRKSRNNPNKGKPGQKAVERAAAIEAAAKEAANSEASE